jgi:pyruvate-formate lyase-activating enzyme
MDFINVSLKSSRDIFYLRYLGLPSVAPIFRNIRIFAESTHVELLTPLANEVGIETLHEIAAFIAGVNPRIPWHLARLFAAYKREKPEAYDFNAIIAFMKEIREELPFVYFGSFPGSEWVDTICPDCKEIVIRRISIGACRMQFASALMDGDCCSACGARIPLVL